MYTKSELPTESWPYLMHIQSIHGFMSRQTLRNGMVAYQDSNASFCGANVLFAEEWNEQTFSLALSES